MIWEEIIKIIVDDIMTGINWVIIILVILHFFRKYVIPQIPKWIHDINMALLERNAIQKAEAVRGKYA